MGDIRTSVLYVFLMCQGPQVKRDELDKKAEPGGFMDIATMSRLTEFLVSRNVKFMENRKWN